MWGGGTATLFFFFLKVLILGGTAFKNSPSLTGHFEYTDVAGCQEVTNNVVKFFLIALNGNIQQMLIPFIFFKISSNKKEPKRKKFEKFV